MSFKYLKEGTKKHEAKESKVEEQDESEGLKNKIASRKQKMLGKSFNKSYGKGKM